MLQERCQLYQMKDSEALREYIFQPFSILASKRYFPNEADYNMVYDNPLRPNEDVRAVRERLSWVLANTITMKEQDGRFSRSNKAWAQAMSIPIDRDGFGSLRNWSYTVESHPAILDLYTTLLRKELERPPQERAAEKPIAREESKPQPEPSKPAKRKSEPSL